MEDWLAFAFVDGNTKKQRLRSEAELKEDKNHNIIDQESHPTLSKIS
jgi:hypothetical protein